jgi:glycosyltransferase involved in cell wall biosynthesis
MTAENVCLSYKYCMPNKLFEYINAGIPVITTNLKDCSELVVREKIGLVLESDNAEGVRNTINFALESDNQNYANSLKAAASKYNWDKEKEKLHKIYIKLLTCV